MCHYQTLFLEADKGYVVHCLLCDHIQVAFGNIAITLNRKEFYSFEKSMKKLFMETAPDQINSGIKNITVPTPSEHIVILLSYRELADMNQMIDQAETELRSLELLGMFGSNGK